MLRKLAVAAAIASSVTCMSAARATFVSVWDYSALTQFTGVNTFDTGRVASRNRDAGFLGCRGWQRLHRG